MCKCTPGIRTPYCGKPGCEWPKQSETSIEKKYIIGLTLKTQTKETLMADISRLNNLLDTIRDKKDMWMTEEPMTEEMLEFLEEIISEMEDCLEI